jgi:hypothetical protein
MAPEHQQNQQKSAPTQESALEASGFDSTTATNSPPAFQLKANPIQRQEVPDAKDTTKAPPVGDVTKTTGTPTDGGASQPADAKSITLSRGVLQFITEGDFNGGDTDCRKPHFPQNIYVFQKLTDDEKGSDEAKKFKGDRFSGPDTIGRFKADKSGDFKRLKSYDRHAEATYTQTLTADQQLGTMGGQSGVSISFGIDIGNKWGTGDKAKVKAYFIAGGVSEDHSTKLSEAAGVKGLEAAKKTATLRTQIDLTHEQVIKILKAAVPETDKGYTRGDGTYHPAIEEVISYGNYWGESAIGKAVKDGVAGKTGAEQIPAARDAVKTKLDALGKDDWRRNGYNSIYLYLAQLADMSAAGFEIKFTDAVLEKDALLKPEEKTFEFVQDVTERKNDYGAGKDLEKQITGTGIAYLIKESVGAGKSAKNNADDVKVVQELLYNGDYDVEVNSTCDDKTKAAIKKFAKDEFKKDYDTIDANGGMMRHLKKFLYRKRTVVTAPTTEPTTPK